MKDPLKSFRIDNDNDNWAYYLEFESGATFECYHPFPTFESALEEAKMVSKAISTGQVPHLGLKAA